RAGGVSSSHETVENAFEYLAIAVGSRPALAPDRLGGRNRILLVPLAHRELEEVLARLAGPIDRVQVHVLQIRRCLTVQRRADQEEHDKKKQDSHGTAIIRIGALAPTAKWALHRHARSGALHR